MTNLSAMFALLTASLALSTTSAGASSSSLLRGGSSSRRARAVPFNQFIFEFFGTPPTTMNCAVAGYSVPPGQSWGGVTCKLLGKYGMIQFDQPSSVASTEPAQFFNEGLTPDNYVQANAPASEAGPETLLFAAELDISITQDGQTSQLQGLRLGYGSDGYADWWAGGPACSVMIVDGTGSYDLTCAENFQFFQGADSENSWLVVKPATF